MRTASVVLAVALIVLVSVCANAAFELRTWATPAAAPATGAPVSTSASFVMRSRLGGPFAGHAESASFALWGCSAYTPVEVAFFAVQTDPEFVTLRWTVESLAGIDGFNVYRSTDLAEPFVRVNEDVIPAASPASYDDESVWPGSLFWYELWAVYGDGSEERLTTEPVSIMTTGTLVTRLYPFVPNPFTVTTALQLDLAAIDGGVRITLYDVSGRVVNTLEPGCDRPGRYVVSWDGTNARGERVASGVYFCRLEADGKTETQRVVVLK